MIRGGHAIVRVSDVARAVRFYVETLGFKRLAGASAEWAEVDAGEGLVIALTTGLAAEGRDARPGAQGAVSLGLALNQPIDEVVEVLANRGVSFDGRVRAADGRTFASFVDPDGNELVLIQTK
jgi:catechol 2,3-dioxygenase-like lactoylglutathione lyase family enzyme